MEHLDEFQWVYCQEAKMDKPEVSYNFVIEFGLHCFTHGPNKHKGETLDDFDSGLHYSDSRETRIFCFDRYSLSEGLPDIAKKVSSIPCFNTGKGNFFVIELLDNNDQPQEYEVYFKVSKEKGGLLRLFVESAYVRDDQHESSQPKKKKIGFFIIAHNTRINKTIKASQ